LHAARIEVTELRLGAADGLQFIEESLRRLTALAEARKDPPR
jgi:hypothetical protein